MLVIEHLVAPPNDRPGSTFGALTMPSGPWWLDPHRDRSATLFAFARFRLADGRPMGTRMGVIEAVPTFVQE